MIKYIVKRISLAIVIMITLSIITFLLMKLAPGDPVRYIVRQDIAFISEDVLEETRRALNLDQSLIMQWWIWFKGILTLNFGTSYQTGQTVLKEIVFYSRPTFTLAILTLIVVISISVPLGVIAAYTHNSVFDRMIQIFTSLTVSVPSFFLGIILIFIFNKLLGILPSSGYYSPKYLIMPVLAISLGMLAYYVRFVRVNMIELIHGKVARAYRLRGINEFSIMWNDLLIPSIIPMITMLGMSLSGLVGGTIVIEYLFNIPGLGTFLIESIRARDYPVVQGMVLVLGALVIIGNTLADIIVGILSPEHRTKGN